ncbi:MAG: CinA family protein [Boseongicola sp.]|nr:CinA family protein [Boseongicola sp.]MDD9978376.1 CinA family protein [Boseongicola sp.]
MTAAEQLLNMARTKGFMVATAESCTGGMVSAALTDIPGSSDVVDRGFVTYTNEAKMEMLGVRPETLDAYGAVSEETAREMAEGALKNSRADLAVSITGIAGPGGSDFKPEGRVCFGVAMADKGTETETVEFGAIGRSKVRANSVQHALKMLISALS